MCDKFIFEMVRSTSPYFSVVVFTALRLFCTLLATNSSGARNLLGLHLFAIDEESKLVTALWKYLESEEIRLAHVERFRDSFARNIELYTNVEDLARNPLAVLKTVKHLTVDFEDVKKFMKTNYNDIVLKTLENGSVILPDKSDLHNEVRNLVDLQRAYNLTVRDVMDGHRFTPDSTEESTLTMEDCFFILTTSAKEHADHKAALAWLQESEYRFDEFTRQEAYKTGILSSLFLGDKILSRRMANDYLRDNPYHRALSNLTTRLSKLLGERVSFKEESEWRCSKACAGDYDGLAAAFRDLKCRYNHHNSPFLIIAPLKEEMLSLDPKVSIFRDVIYESEIELLKSDSYDKEQRWCVQAKSTRSSYSFVNNRQPKYAKLWNRLEDLSSLSMTMSESFQMIHYAPGGFYRVHSDFIGKKMEKKMQLKVKGNRIATALMYLNTVTLGGNTVFPHLKLSVKPVEGSILFWMNMEEDQGLDLYTFHAACPVVYGEKLACTQWFRMNGQNHWIAEPEDDEKAHYSLNPNVVCQIRT